MAQRIFELPGIQDLTKEQETVRALSKTGQHLVIGGPGTGKSVIALLRARRHASAKEPHLFLVYNKLLQEASCHLGSQKINCQQWMSWFLKIFRNITGHEVPRMEPEPGSTFRAVDWDAADTILSLDHLDSSSRPEYLIIDEGQDMPPEFYHTLIRLGFENFFVVADQNQQIVSGQNSSRRDIELALGLNHKKVIELKENYRNTRAVAELASAFYTRERASPPLELPRKIADLERIPIVFTYKPSQFPHMIDRILKMADREPHQLIGVIAPNNTVRLKYHDELKLRLDKNNLDNANLYIRTYCYQNRFPVHFNKGGIMVINAQACKGLEFDHVFIVDIDEYRYPLESDDTIKRSFYVMVARARNNVFLLQQQGRYCPVKNILPEDNMVLEAYPKY